MDTFIAKYRPDWDRLDAATRRGTRSLARLTGPDLDEVVRLYLRTSGNLAEAQTRFPDPQMLRYLTAMVSRAHVAIYGTRAASAS